MRDTNDEAILVTGASGYLGSLVAASALDGTTGPVVLPVRGTAARETVVAAIAAELRARGRPVDDATLARLIVLPLPPADRILELVPALRELGVASVLHCAGCLSYFNVTRLRAGNVGLTRAMLALARTLDVRRFVFVSTAYSAGFVDGPIHEALHDGPRRDPTDYTTTKREAEWLVAESGLPWVIVRPSIVIGDSRDGRYGGKPYGPYQLWKAAERYLPDGLPPVLHVVSGTEPVNFLHQDAFAAGLWAAHRDLPDGAIVHLASRHDGLPTMRDLWQLWLGTYGGTEEVHFYAALDDVPAAEVDPRLRLWLDFTAVNAEIASVRWEFRLDTLERLRGAGLRFPDVTLDTMRISQDRFVRDSPGLRRFVERCRATGGGVPRFVSHLGNGRPASS